MQIKYKTMLELVFGIMILGSLESIRIHQYKIFITVSRVTRAFVINIRLPAARRKITLGQSGQTQSLVIH